MACQTTYSKLTLIKNVCQGISKELAMENNMIFNLIFLYQLRKPWRMPGIVQFTGTYTSNNMKEDIGERSMRCRTSLIILTNTSYQTVITMPIVNLSDTYQMKGIIRFMPIMEWYTVEVNTITNIDSPLAKYFLGIREGDNSIHLCREPMTEKLVNLQSHTGYKRKANELSIVRIGWYLCDSMDSCLFKFLKKVNQPGIGIHKTTSIDELNSFSKAIVKNAIIV